MTLSTSLMNGTTQVRISEENTLQLIIPKGEMPDELKQFADNPYQEEELEPLALHAMHCPECYALMTEAIARGERIDNIVVPRHDDVALQSLAEELKKSKMPFIIPKNNTIH